MAINNFFKRDINRLVDPRNPFTSLPPRGPAPLIDLGRGVGLPAEFLGNMQASGVRAECLNVWSELIITEDGAFEVPHGWPLDGAYPDTAVPPDPIPPSLKLVSGVLSLDIGVQYYLQKRVHLVIFEEQQQGSSVSVLKEDHLYIPFEIPFLGQGYYRSTTPYTASWTLPLKMGVLNGNPFVASRVEELTALGVQFA